MVCGKCGKAFDESAGYRGTLSVLQDGAYPKGDPIRELKGILSYIAQHFGEKTLLDRRRTDALIADIFPKENAARRLCYVALYDGCAQKLWTVRGKPFEVRSAAAARCVKSLRDEIGLKGRSAASAVEQSRKPWAATLRSEWARLPPQRPKAAKTSPTVQSSTAWDVTSTA
ncbi:MAG: hypothetical protein ACLSG5_11555 [Oscillospiraceae bacterium]